METRRLGEQQAEARTKAGDAPSFERRTLGGGASTEPPGRPRSGKGWLAAGALAAGLVAAVAGYTLKSEPAGPPADPTMSVQQQAERINAFQARGQAKLDAVPAAETRQALDAMGLNGDQRAAIEKDLERSDVRLVYIVLWDDQVEDGDVVEIKSSGFQQRISLTKAPQKFTIPIAGGTLQMRGLRDGGGGITVAAQADGGPLLVPIMEPGQVIDVPVGVK